MPHIKIETEPWSVPNFVLAKLGGPTTRSTSMSLDAVEATTLSELCDEFRREVFAKAKKVDPRAPGLRG